VVRYERCVAFNANSTVFRVARYRKMDVRWAEDNKHLRQCSDAENPPSTNRSTKQPQMITEFSASPVDPLISDQKVTHRW